MNIIKYTDTRLLIDDTWCEARDGRTIDVINPASGLSIGKVAHAGKADLDRALQAVQAGFHVWRKIPALERAHTMRRAASLMRERVEGIATLMTLEQGKPLNEARQEVLSGADIIEWFADESVRVYGRIVPSRNWNSQQQVYKDPIGPVAAFTPWNFPINQIARKLGGALACGCSVLVKAPEETPASPAALIRAFVDAGLPAGTVGLVFGDPAEISSYLISHPIIRKFTFTGSTAVGKHLAALAGTYMKRSTMELGGHAPVVVADDADIELAVKAASISKFRNAGQVCIAPTRFLVHTDIYNQFVDGLVEYANSLKLGNGLDEGITMGPLANARRVNALESMIIDAKNKGATIATGGLRVGEVGNFFSPTVLVDVPLDSAVFNDEPFGPVAAIHRFGSLSEMIAEANRLSFGLGAYAFTQSLRNVRILTQEIEAGMLWVNQPTVTAPELPIGGVKDSGHGSEGGTESLEAYLNTKLVSIMS